MELLTASGWSPACSLESLLVQVVMAIVEGQGRVDLAGSTRRKEYQEKDAHEAFERAARTHGWKTS
jgi:ubiquitin-conjugating enzyme E2 Q